MSQSEAITLSCLPAAAARQANLLRLIKRLGKRFWHGNRRGTSMRHISSLFFCVVLFISTVVQASAEADREQLLKETGVYATFAVFKASEQWWQIEHHARAAASGGPWPAGWACRRGRRRFRGGGRRFDAIYALFKRVHLIAQPIHFTFKTGDRLVCLRAFAQLAQHRVHITPRPAIQFSACRRFQCGNSFWIVECAKRHRRGRAHRRQLHAQGTALPS